MTSPVFIGIDIGTSNTKSALFDIDGRLLGEASMPVELRYFEDGCVEQDPAQYLTAVQTTVSKAIGGDRELADRVMGIGLTGQMGSLIGLDANGDAVTPCDSVIDTRCEPIRERVLAEYGDLVFELNAVFPYTAPKLCWWRENEPHTYSQIRSVVMPHGFVAMWLTGLGTQRAVMDRTCIGLSGLSDVRKAEWSGELCDLWSIDMALLPEIVEPDEVIGYLEPSVARSLGLKNGIPVVAGAGDAVAGWLGAGAVDPGTVVDTSGTSHHFSLVTDKLRTDTSERILTYFPSALPDLWHALGYNSSSGLVHQWFVREFATSAASPFDEAAELYAVLETAAATVSPGSEGLLFAPHLGGRVCPPQPHMRGAWVNFSWQHQRRHFYRAMLEAVAYEYAFYLQAAQRLQPGLAPTDVWLIGGGTRSQLWKRIKADVLGLDYLSFPGTHHACFGAALLAARGVGSVRDLAEHARELVRPIERTESDMQTHRLYQDYVDKYIELLDQMSPVFIGLRSLPQEEAQTWN